MRFSEGMKFGEAMKILDNGEKLMNIYDDSFMYIYIHQGNIINERGIVTPISYIRGWKKYLGTKQDKIEKDK